MIFKSFFFILCFANLKNIYFFLLQNHSVTDHKSNAGAVSLTALESDWSHCRPEEEEEEEEYCGVRRG